MQSIQRFTQRNFYTLLMLLLTGGFIILLVELLLTNHTDGIQLVAVAAAVTGALFAGIGLFANRVVRNVLAVLFLLLSITGLVGAYEHFEEGNGFEASTKPVLLALNSDSAPVASFLADDDDEEGERGGEGEYGEAGEGGEEGEETPPPLAPLSLAGLSLFGAVTLLGRQDPVNDGTER